MGVRSWLVPADAHIHLIGLSFSGFVFERVQSVLASLDVLLTILLELGNRVVLNSVRSTVLLFLLLWFITSAKT